MRPVELSGLPPEILEQILLPLPPADILKMKEVNRLFLGFVSGSQCLQHHIDLFSAGLVDNLEAERSLAERRVRLRKYVNGWERPSSFPLKNETSVFHSHPTGQGLLFECVRSRNISFIRIPSSPDQGTIEEWTLALQFDSAGHMLSWQDNLLAIVEQGTGFINVHLLNLLDGSPHKVPLQKILTLDLGHFRGFLVTSREIGGSRIALVVDLSSFTRAKHHKELIIWDWKTGEVVFNYSGHDPGVGVAITGIRTVQFLEETWLLAVSHCPAPVLLVFNMHLPQHDPRSWRTLQLPRLTRGGTYSVVTQYKNPLVERPDFSVDPTQKNFVLFSPQDLTLVVPVELLIRCMDSVRVDSRVLWDDWGKDALTVYPHPDTVTVQLVDAKLLALRGTAYYQEEWGAEMYDLSKSAQKDIEVLRIGEERDGRYMRVLSTPKWFDPCQMGAEIPSNTFLVGNNVVCFYKLTRTPGGAYRLRIRKIASHGFEGRPSG